MTIRGLVLLSAFLIPADLAIAAQIFPISYEMPNGAGQAHGGGYNYWDLSYNGTGSPAVDSSPLSGGLGDLTDGVIATANWFDTENVDGTGPYVGWTDKATPNPLVTFRFAGPLQLASVTIYVDDADGYGGVSVPASVDLGLEGGPLVNYLTVDPGGSAPTSFTFSGLGLSGPAISLRFHNASEWIFLSEVTFDGELASVPEPATFLSAGGVLSLLALRLRR